MSAFTGIVINPPAVYQFLFPVNGNSCPVKFPENNQELVNLIMYICRF
jgi:hypothetical protein